MLVRSLAPFAVSECVWAHGIYKCWNANECNYRLLLPVFFLLRCCCLLMCYLFIYLLLLHVIFVFSSRNWSSRWNTQQKRNTKKTTNFYTRNEEEKKLFNAIVVAECIVTTLISHSVYVFIHAIIKMGKEKEREKKKKKYNEMAIGQWPFLLNYLSLFVSPAILFSFSYYRQINSSFL